MQTLIFSQNLHPPEHEFPYTLATKLTLKICTLFKKLPLMKMKSFFRVLAAVVLSHTAFTQTLVTQVKPVGGKEWGYANLKGDLIIPAQFRKYYQFSAER